MDSLERLVELFREFPGIGPRQARRFAYFLLSRNKSYTDELAIALQTMKKNISLCSMCFRFFPESYRKEISERPLCTICSNPSRDASQLLVVSRDIDLESIEKSRSYNGLYFVLGGSVPILEKNPEMKIRAKELTARIENDVQKGLQEVILSLNVNPEGENTADYIKSLLSPYKEKNALKISILGRGLSTGSELEYTDSETIRNALSNRR